LIVEQLPPCGFLATHHYKVTKFGGLKETLLGGEAL
jgi:hypothetical protein